MGVSFIEIFRSTLFAFIGFILGFVLGTLLDIAFFKVYHRIDPKRDSNAKLVCLMLVQILIVLFIGQTISYYHLGSSFLFGLMTAQLFLIKYAVKRISNYMSDRTCTDVL